MSKGSTSAACSTALCWCPVSSVISADLLDVVGPEGLRQALFQAARPLGGPGGEPLGRVLGPLLAAPPEGPNLSTRGVDADEGEQMPSPAGGELADQPALGAQGGAVGGGLDVAASHHPTVVDQGGSAHAVAGVGHVGPPRDLTGDLEQM